MLKTILPPAFIVAALCSMPACSDLQNALDFSDKRDAFSDRRDALSDRSNSAYSAVPDTGTSTYRGEASLGIGTRSQGVVLLGDAEIVIDFGTNAVEGTLDNFAGYDTDENYSEYSGELIFVDGLLGVDRPNDLESQITGTLTGQVYTIGVDAFWEGDLKGTPIRGVLGDTSLGDSTFTLNDGTVVGGIIIAVSN